MGKTLLQVDLPVSEEVPPPLFKAEISTIKSSVEYYIRNPSGRMGRADEVARMALVLASDLSGYMKGTIVIVDGGQLSI